MSEQPIVHFTRRLLVKARHCEETELPKLQRSFLYQKAYRESQCAAEIELSDRADFDGHCYNRICYGKLNHCSEHLKIL